MFYSMRLQNSREQLLTTPSAIFSRLIADLHNAHTSIDMEFYIFASDRTGSTIADILCRKARQGVSVRLIVDGYGSRTISRAMLQQLLNAGVSIYRHPLLSNNRNHRKMTIIDRHTAHVGGVNIADRYSVGNNLGVWHDVQLRLRGGAVATLATLFDYDVTIAEGGCVAPPAPLSPRGIQLYWSEANGGRAMEHLLEDVVTSAERSITLTTPYFMPPRRVLSLLCSAIARGVRVTIIVPERCDVWALDNLARSYIARAQALGINMLIMREGFIHAKLAIVDHRRTILGSANLDARSLNINRELMLSTYNKEVCRMADNFILSLREKCSLPRRSDLNSPFPQFMAKLLEPVL